MKPYLTTLIATLSIACSGQTASRTADDSHSYQSLTAVQQDECARLFRESENTPTLFHTASPACQDYMGRVTISEYARGIIKIDSLLTTFAFSYGVKTVSKDVAALDACTNFLFDAIESVTLPNSPTPTSYDDCMKKMDEAQEYRCIKAKKEYLDQLTKFETALQKAYHLLEVRIPLASTHQDYQHVKHIMHKAIADNRTKTQQFVCQK